MYFKFAFQQCSLYQANASEIFPGPTFMSKKGNLQRALPVIEDATDTNNYS
jgi:hypothetical protein